MNPAMEARMAQRETAIVITLSTDERARLGAAAAALELPLATWARAELLRIADRIAARHR